MSKAAAVCVIDIIITKYCYTIKSLLTGKDNGMHLCHKKTRGDIQTRVTSIGSGI